MRGSETASGGAEATKGEWGKQPGNFQWQNCSENKNRPQTSNTN